MRLLSRQAKIWTKVTKNFRNKTKRKSSRKREKLKKQN
jgi:hypothetical protein